MRFLFKAVILLLLLAAIALMVYAALFDLPPPERDIIIPVETR